MNRVRVVSFVWMCSALVLAACGGDDKKLELGGACTLNSDCADGLLCKFGACHKACVKSIDCAAGERCVQVDGVAVCEAAACAPGCPAPLVCNVSDQTCRNTCSPTNYCLGGQVCTAGMCFEFGEADAGQSIDAGGADIATTPDTAPVAVDLPAATPDASVPDAPVAVPDVSDARRDTSVGAETAGETGGSLTCVDKDGDGYGVGAGCRGPDCDDSNTNVWISCATCQDADGDGYFVGCDRYVSPIMGPDCDDTAPFCTNSCVDADKNGTADCAEYWFGEESIGSIWPFNTADGNFLVAGQTNQGFGGMDIQIIKLTPSGRVLWRKIYGSAKDERLEGAVQATDGSLLLTVDLGTNDSWLPLIVKVSEDGTVLASKTVPAANPNETMDDCSAALLPNGDFIVSGSVGTQFDSWVGQLSADLLTFQWQTKYTGLGKGTTLSLLRFPDGDLFASRGVYDNKSGNLLKLGPKGELRWARGVPWRPQSVLTPDGNVTVAWIAQGSPFAVAKLTPAGDLLWQRSTVGLGGANPGTWLTTDSAGNVLVKAHVDSATATGVTWLTKLSPDGDVLWTHSVAKYMALAFPDASSGYLLVSGKGVGHMGSDPSTSCVLGPQTDVLKPSTATFTAVTPVVTTMTPWILADYPINTMSGTVTWKPICPAATP